MPGRVIASLIGRAREPSSTGSAGQVDPHPPSNPLPHTPTVSLVPLRLRGQVHDEGSMKQLARAAQDRVSLEQRRPTSKGSGRATPTAPTGPARLEMQMESPPLVFMGPPATSTGALLSGQLKLVVDDADVRIAEFSLVLRASVITKKPVSAHCAGCAGHVTDLFRWVLLKEPKTFRRGTHEFPFSYLLPGRLPASSRGVLAEVEYGLFAQASTCGGDAFRLERSLEVQRAIAPGPERNSIRIFPPTALTAHVTLPSLIHPIGEFPVYFRMDGLVTKGKKTQTRWRLRKLSWRLEEESRMISPACAKHSQKLGGEGKGILHTDSRTIGADEFKSGWKTDFGSNDGEVEMEFKAAIRPGKAPVCDVESSTGLTVGHNLVLELVVAEEYCSFKKPQGVTPTGAARILRMTFNLPVTERSGLGISWDEEQPPMYDDVPPSPPTYIQMEDYVGPPLEEEDLERLPAN